MKRLHISILASLISAIAGAKITLPVIISSNMVLQRDAQVVVWGWSDQKEVSLRASWLEGDLTIPVGENGKWTTELQTSLSTDPQSLKLFDKTSTIELEDILFGEVWLCSGQSNMAMPLKGAYGQPVYG